MKRLITVVALMSLPQTGWGTSPLFNPVVTYSFGDPSVSVVAMAAADMNGDGKLDLVAVNSCCAVSVAFNSGSGTFGPPVQYPLPGTTYGDSVAVGDFDGDGKPSVAGAGS